jgi:hypothetical protein
MYYDAEKEAFNEKIKRIKAKYDIENNNGSEPKEGYVPGIRRGSMRNYFKTHAAKSKKRSNLRLLIVLMVLLLIAYYLIFGYKF